MISITAFIIVAGFILWLLVRDIKNRLNKNKTVKKESSWLEYQLAKDEAEDSLQDYLANSKYRRAISEEAIEIYCNWDNICTSGDIHIMRGGRILTVGRNHKEVFGDKTFEELIEEEVLKLKLQHRTPEQIEEHDRKREEYFWNRFSSKHKLIQKPVSNSGTIKNNSFYTNNSFGISDNAWEPFGSRIKDDDDQPTHWQPKSEDNDTNFGGGSFGGGGAGGSYDDDSSSSNDNSSDSSDSSSSSDD